MPVKRFKPATPSRRFTTVPTFEEITETTPLKSLTKPKSRRAGRNRQGRITVRHRGGGAKKLYRIIDFKRDKDDTPATVASIEYDPNRSARIALLHYSDGEKRYIIAPQDLQVGDVVVSGKNVDVRIGNALPLSAIPVGTEIHNLELKPGKGAELVRGAGTAAQLLAKEGKYAQVRLPSGEIRLIHLDCRATIGQVGNVDRKTRSSGKAGVKRNLGRRPRVRGVVMSPKDHPHGGGEGRSPIGRKNPMSPWGKPTLGYKTRKKGKSSDKMIVKRRR